MASSSVVFSSSNVVPKFDRTNVKFITSRQHAFLPQHEMPKFRRSIARDQGSEAHLVDATTASAPYYYSYPLMARSDPLSTPSFLSPFALYDWDEVMFSLTPHISGSAEARLHRFMMEYAPERLVPGWTSKVLSVYAGKETQLFNSLVMKYGPEPKVERVKTQILGSEEDSISRGISELDAISKLYSTTVNYGGGGGGGNCCFLLGNGSGSDTDDGVYEEEEDDGSHHQVGVPVEEQTLITRCLRRSLIANRMERLKKENHLRTVTSIHEPTGERYFCLDTALFHLFWPLLLDELVDPASIVTRRTSTTSGGDSTTTTASPTGGDDDHDAAAASVTPPAEYLGLIGDKMFALLVENPELVALFNNQICTYKCVAITCSPMLFSKLRDSSTTRGSTSIHLSNDQRRAADLMYSTASSSTATATVLDPNSGIDVLSLLVLGSFVSCIYIQPQDYHLHEVINKLKKTTSADSSTGGANPDAILVQYEEEGSSSSTNGERLDSAAILATLALPEHISALPVSPPQRSEVLRLEQEFTHRILQNVQKNTTAATTSEDNYHSSFPLPRQVASILINQSICPVLDDPLATLDGAWSMNTTPQNSQNNRQQQQQQQSSCCPCSSVSSRSSGGYGETKQQFRMEDEDGEDLDEVLLEILREDGYDIPCRQPAMEISKATNSSPTASTNNSVSVDFCSTLGLSGELNHHVQKAGILAQTHAAELTTTTNSACSRASNGSFLESSVSSSVYFRLEAYGMLEEDSDAPLAVSDWHSVGLRKAARVSRLVRDLLSVEGRRRSSSSLQSVEKEPLFVPISLQRLCSTDSLEGLCWYIDRICGGGQQQDGELGGSGHTSSSNYYSNDDDDLVLLDLMEELDAEVDLVPRASFVQRTFLWKWIFEPAMVQHGDRDPGLELLLSGGGDGDSGDNNHRQQEGGSTSSSSSSYHSLFPWELQFEDEIKRGVVGRVTQFLELATYLNIPTLKRLMRFCLVQLAVDF